MVGKLLRVHSVARLLDQRPHAVYRMIREGLLPAVYLGRAVRVDEQKLEDFISKGGQRLSGGWRREPFEANGIAKPPRQK